MSGVDGSGGIIVVAAAPAGVASLSMLDRPSRRTTCSAAGILFFAEPAMVVRVLGAVRGESDSRSCLQEAAAKFQFREECGNETVRHPANISISVFRSTNAADSKCLKPC